LRLWRGVEAHFHKTARHEDKTKAGERNLSFVLSVGKYRDLRAKKFFLAVRVLFGG
jgi:hypothetical protein